MDVSCIPISGLVAFLDSKNIDPRLVLRGQGPDDSVSLNDLSGPDCLVSWQQLTAVFSRAEKLLSGNGQIDELVIYMLADKGLLLPSLSSITKNLLSPAMLYEIFLNFIGSRYFSTAAIKFDLTQPQYHLSCEIPDPNVQGEVVFRLIQKALELLPEKIGCKRATVTAEIGPYQCIYTITPPAGFKLLIRIWRRIKAMFITNEILRELIALESSIAKKHARHLGTNRQMAKKREESLETSQNKNQFLTSMSHEIRTHMTSVLGFAELIKNPKSSPQNFGSYVDTILRNGKHMLHIIDNILDLSKVEAGHLRFNRTHVNLRQLLNESLEPIKLLAAKKDLNFVIHVSTSLPEHLITDTNRFLQVINYVLTNAVKYTHQGTLTLTIEPSVSPNNYEGVEITVEDTGNGLSPEFTRLLFNPYNAFEMENKKKNSAAGLEFALARALAVSMEGDIKPFPNLEGVGTRFSISMHSIPGVGEAETLSIENFSIPIAQLNAGPLLKSKKILITEDNKDIQQIIKKTVEDAGAETEIANNGIECLAMVENSDFDIILMDLQMPLMDGFETIERLRAGGYKRPIIVVTAYALNNERERCIKVGCTDFVSKPINNATLLKTLVRHQNLT